MENTAAERIADIHEKQKAFFRTGATLDLAFRKEMLKKLNPSQLILYGAMTDPIREQVKDIPHICIESEQKQRMNRCKEN